MMKAILGSLLSLLVAFPAYCENFAAQKALNDAVKSFEIKVNGDELVALSTTGITIRRPVKRKVAAKSTTVIQGNLSLRSDTCGGGTPSFRTRLKVTQSGRNFTVIDPDGFRLKGQGSTRGFDVSASELRDDGLTMIFEIVAGATSSRGATKVGLAITIQSPTGDSCQAKYLGVMTRAK